MKKIIKNADIQLNPVYGRGNNKKYSSQGKIVAEMNDIGSVTENVTSAVSATTGTVVSAYVVRYENVVQLALTFTNSSSVASGSNVFVGTLSKYTPAISGRGLGYYGGSALVMSVSKNGAITIRNTGGSSATCSSNTTVTGTWII